MKKVGEKILPLFKLCAIVILVLGPAVTLADDTHGIFFDAKFGFLSSFPVSASIPLLAVIFGTLGWLNGLLIPYGKSGTKFIDQRLLVVIPFVLVWVISFLFYRYMRDIYDGSPYWSLKEFAICLPSFYAAGFLSSILDFIYRQNLDQKKISIQ